MVKATITIDKAFQTARLDRRIFGSFVEHLGRAVYGGIYQPSSPFSDEKGMRRDTLALVRELRTPLVRYPGGNFVSGYRWEDGIGPVESRPRRVDPAWLTIESNRFGLDEFMDWCGKAGAQPMMAVNLGTRDPIDARNILEYCNFPGGTQYSDMRVKNGGKDPYGVQLWCLGNEMDGPWQMGCKTAFEYGRLAQQASHLMKMLDPGIETVACGSSNLEMPTFGFWEETVLEQCYDDVDYISMHQYYGNPNGDTPDFLAASVGMDRFIRQVVSICDCVAAKKRSPRKVNISFDEWNVWYHTKAADENYPKWTEAPPLLEDVYNMEDALLVGSMLITLLRHADRVKIACMAQLVNVIAPIMTSDKGAWRQTIFYPYLHASAMAGDTVLQTLVDAPCYESKSYGEASFIDAVATCREEDGEIVLFMVNKSLDQEASVGCDLRQFEGYRVAEQLVMRHDDLKAVNTEAAPSSVLPCAADTAALENGLLAAVLPPASWNVIRLAGPER